MNTRLDEFARQLKLKMEEVDTVSGKKALDLQTELSAYIAAQTQTLVNEGISVMEIQDALRAAAGRVQQTRAPDAPDTPDADESDAESGERLEPPLCVFTFFLPMEEAAIAAFAAGDFDAPAMIERIRLSPDITSLEMMDGLDLVVSDFGKNQELSEVIGGGE
ncbi:MAG: hypothetical protein LBH35_08330, partial [Treponema sp.]|nr:hypothetical protein [Treponema sp.]